MAWTRRQEDQLVRDRFAELKRKREAAGGGGGGGGGGKRRMRESNGGGRGQSVWSREPDGRGGGGRELNRRRRKLSWGGGESSGCSSSAQDNYNAGDSSPDAELIGEITMEEFFARRRAAEKAKAAKAAKTAATEDVGTRESKISGFADAGEGKSGYSSDSVQDEEDRKGWVESECSGEDSDEEEDEDYNEASWEEGKSTSEGETSEWEEESEENGEVQMEDPQTVETNHVICIEDSQSEPEDKEQEEDNQIAVDSEPEQVAAAAEEEIETVHVKSKAEEKEEEEANQIVGDSSESKESAAPAEEEIEILNIETESDSEAEEKGEQEEDIEIMDVDREEEEEVVTLVVEEDVQIVTQVKTGEFRSSSEDIETMDVEREAETEARAKEKEEEEVTVVVEEADLQIVQDKPEVKTGEFRRSSEEGGRGRAEIEAESGAVDGGRREGNGPAWDWAEVRNPGQLFSANMEKEGDNGAHEDDQVGEEEYACFERNPIDDHDDEQPKTYVDEMELEQLWEEMEMTQNEAKNEERAKKVDAKRVVAPMGGFKRREPKKFVAKPTGLRSKLGIEEEVRMRADNSNVGVKEYSNGETGLFWIETLKNKEQKVEVGFQEPSFPVSTDRKEAEIGSVGGKGGESNGEAGLFWIEAPKNKEQDVEIGSQEQPFLISSERKEVEIGIVGGKGGESNGVGWHWGASPKNKEQEVEIGSKEQQFLVSLEEEEEAIERTNVIEGKKKQQCAVKPNKPPKKVLKESEVLNILAKSVLEGAELPVEDEEGKKEGELPVEDEEGKKEAEQPAQQQQQQWVVPNRIYDEQPCPPEKTEEEKEMACLWEEMALAQYGDEDSSSTPEDSVSSPELEPDSAGTCSEGCHQLILDEEIGVICRLCLHVETEIRYYVAPFVERNFRYLNKGSSNNQRMDEMPDKAQPADCESDTQSHPDCHKLNEGTVWDIIPEIREGLHSHQRDGFEFLWRNIGGDTRLAKLKDVESPNSSSGCIIAHAPGTGKTRLTIRFLQTYMKRYPKCRPIIIVPCSMLLTWEAEFRTLGVETPRHNLNDTNLSGKESSIAVDLLKDYRGLRTVRWVKIYSWQKEGGILLMTYSLFQNITRKRMKKKSKVEEEESIPEEESVDEGISKALLKFPGLLVLDEGHSVRNDEGLMWKALATVKTQKRIVLSGTPFQNNFMEFFNTLWVARPNFIQNLNSPMSWVQNKNPGKEVKEAREKWQTLICHLEKDKTDWRKAKQLQQLKALIGPFIHVYRGDILQEKLPGLRESVLMLRPGDFQRDQIARVQVKSQSYGLIDGRKDWTQYFEWERVVSLASVHPYLLTKCNKKWSESVDEGSLTRLGLVPEAGVKTKFLMELIRICQIINEKVLVFSQFLDPSKMIAKQLESQLQQRPGIDFLIMNGSLSTDNRQAMMKNFNDPSSEAKVLLASTRACSEGISLIGASRVVLLDVVWNPSVTKQAVSRAYRLGQTKVVHVYNLITSGTIEEDKYKRQMKKDQLSEMILFSTEGADCGRKEMKDLPEEEKDKVLEMLLERESLQGIFKEIIYQPKDSKPEVAPPGLLDL